MSRLPPAHRSSRPTLSRELSGVGLLSPATMGPLGDPKAVSYQVRLEAASALPPRIWTIHVRYFDSQVDSHAGGNRQTAADKTAVRSSMLRLWRLSADVHRPSTNRLLISGAAVIDAFPSP